MKQILTDGLRAMDIPVTERMLEQMADYGAALLHANQTTNLTAIRESDAAARLHFLDCAALVKMADFGGKRIIDVGSGAGFPGVPLAVLCPDSSVTLVDSVRKKMDFAQSACQSAGISNVTPLWGRAEELTQFRGGFDFAVSRAVADLAVLAELCMPLVKKGGLFAAMKGPECGEELENAVGAFRKLGGGEPWAERYTIPGTDVTHAVVFCRKEIDTPFTYPRRYSQIVKKPLK